MERFIEVLKRYDIDENIAKKIYRDLNYKNETYKQKILDVSDMDIDDDEFIEICDRYDMRRIEKIILFGNPKITEDTIEYILESDQIGSLRDTYNNSSLGLGVSNVTVYCDDYDEYDEKKYIRYDFKYYYPNGTKGLREVYPSIKRIYIRDAYDKNMLK